MPAPDTNEKFPVVMLYDHLSSVGAAIATYSQLSRELAREFVTELRVWRMDDATSADYSEAANADIAAAEVIILSVRGNPPWPEKFLHWMAGAEDRGEPGPHGVVTLITSADCEVPAGGGEEGCWNHVLRSAATAIHPEVFVYETKTERDSRSEADRCEIALVR